MVEATFVPSPTLGATARPTAGLALASSRLNNFVRLSLGCHAAGLSAHVRSSALIAGGDRESERPGMNLPTPSFGRDDGRGSA